MDITENIVPILFGVSLPMIWSGVTTIYNCFKDRMFEYEEITDKYKQEMCLLTSTLNNFRDESKREKEKLVSALDSFRDENKREKEKLDLILNNFRIEIDKRNELFIKHTGTLSDNIGERLDLLRQLTSGGSSNYRTNGLLAYNVIDTAYKRKNESETAYEKYREEMEELMKDIGHRPEHKSEPPDYSQSAFERVAYLDRNDKHILLRINPDVKELTEDEEYEYFVDRIATRHNAIRSTSKPNKQPDSPDLVIVEKEED